MKEFFQKQKKMFYSAMILCGAVGFILFFPVNLDDQYTCAGHIWFNRDCPCRLNTEHNNQASNAGSEHNHSNALLEYYLVNYAAGWWLSSGILAVGLILLWHAQKKLKSEIIKKIQE